MQPFWFQLQILWIRESGMSLWNLDLIFLDYFSSIAKVLFFQLLKGLNVPSDKLCLCVNTTYINLLSQNINNIEFDFTKKVKYLLCRSDHCWSRCYDNLRLTWLIFFEREVFREYILHFRRQHRQKGTHRLGPLRTNSLCRHSLRTPIWWTIHEVS